MLSQDQEARLEMFRRGLFMHQGRLSEISDHNSLMAAADWVLDAHHEQDAGVTTVAMSMRELHRKLLRTFVEHLKTHSGR